jgi:hypothetical protein
MHNRPAAVRPFDGPVNIELRAQWEALHDGQGDLWLPDVGPDSLGTIAAAQSTSPNMQAHQICRWNRSTPASLKGGMHGLANRIAPVALPQPGWTSSPSPAPWSSRMGKSGPASATALASASCPQTPPQRSALAVPRKGPWGSPALRRHRPCPTLAAQTTLHHDFLKGILSRIMHRAGIASTLERSLRCLPSFADDSGTYANGSGIRVEVREEILLALPQGISITDISYIHPLSTAAATAGAVAARRDQQRRQEQWPPEGISRSWHHRNTDTTSRNSTATHAHQWAQACQPGTPSHWTSQAYPDIHGI